MENSIAKEVCKKVSFADEKNALKYIDKLKKTSIRDKIPVNVYLCEKCFCWHLTNRISIEQKETIYLKRQINNLKSKILHLENENSLLKLKLIKI